MSPMRQVSSPDGRPDEIRCCRRPRSEHPYAATPPPVLPLPRPVRPVARLRRAVRLEWQLQRSATGLGDEEFLEQRSLAPHRGNGIAFDDNAQFVAQRQDAGRLDSDDWQSSFRVRLESMDEP